MMTVSEQKQHIYIIYIKYMYKLFCILNVCWIEKGDVFQFFRCLHINPYAILVDKVLTGGFSLDFEVASHPVRRFSNPTAYLAALSAFW